MISFQRYFRYSKVSNNVTLCYFFNKAISTDMPQYVTFQLFDEPHASRYVRLRAYTPSTANMQIELFGCPLEGGSLSYVLCLHSLSPGNYSIA